MRLLLDTHVLLWALTEPERLGAEARALIEDPDNEVLFSAASIWEIAIKAGLGRPDFAFRPDEVARGAAEAGFVELTVRAGAAAKVVDLPPHHRDPFDRLLVAQAMAGPMRLLTADPQLPPYSELAVLI
ncbi:type II toxin-antitoxin system VapC family toxin [Roseomonas sp. GCM10028921]